MKHIFLKQSDELEKMIINKSIKLSWIFLIVTLILDYAYEFIKYGKVPLALGLILPLSIVVYSLSFTYQSYCYSKDEHENVQSTTMKVISIIFLIAFLALILLGIVFFDNITA